MGENNINKLSFFQKVELAKQNLKSQGKNAPSTADIVNEMVNITKAEKADGNALPDGYKIEHTAATRAVGDANSPTMEVYDSPNIPKINTALTLMLNIIQKLSVDITISQEGKQEIVDILLSMVDLMKTGSNVPQEIIDLINGLSNEIVVVEPVLVYDTPDIPQLYENPKVKATIDFVSKFMSNSVIPDDIKGKLMEIINNIGKYDDPKSSATEFLLLVTNKLITDNNLPQNIINEFINILNELGLDGRITSEDGILICEEERPDIANNPKYQPLFDLIEKIMSNDSIPDEIKGKFQNILLNPDNIGNIQKSIQAIILDAINKLISENNISENVINALIDIVNSLGLDAELEPEDGTVVCVYDTPNNNPIITGLIKFVDGILFSDKIPDEIKAKLVDIINNMNALGLSPDAGIAETLIAVINKLFSEMDINDDMKQEIINIINNLGVEDDLEEITINEGGYCVYDTPDIRQGKLSLILDILEKIKASNSQIPDNYKYELALLLKEIIISLVGQDNVPPEVLEKLDEILGIGTGIEETTTAETATKNKPVVKTLLSGNKILVVPRYDNNGNLTDYVDLSGRVYGKQSFRE